MPGTDRILVVVPMAPGASPVRMQTYSTVAQLRWHGPLDIVWLRDDQPIKPHNCNLADKLNQAAQLAIAGDYAGMLIVEADMIVPPDALLCMAEVDADIVYGLYCSRTAGGHPWLYCTHVDEFGSTWPSVAQRVAAWRRVVPSAGIGTGCTLISLKALTRLPEFRGDDAGGFAPDWYLAIDAARLGLTQAHHMGVVCGHIIDADHVLWPDVDKPDLYRIDAYPQALVMAGNMRYVVRQGSALAVGNDIYRPGDVLTINPEQAPILLRKGVIEVAP